MARRRNILLAMAGGALLLLGAAVAPSRTRAGAVGEAWEAMEFMDFKNAVARFESARAQAPADTDAWFETTMGLAVSLHQRQPEQRAEKERAGRLYDEIIAAPGKRRVQALALLLRARLADQLDYFGDAPDEELARSLYSRILSDWPDESVAHQAALYRAQLDIFSMNAERARRGVGEMVQWIETHPENPLAAVQWMLVGLAWTSPLDDPARAVEAYRRAESAGLPRHIQRDAFFWRVANLAQRAGQPTVAAAYYRNIITEIGRSGFAYESQVRLRDMGEEPPPLIDPFSVADQSK